MTSEQGPQYVIYHGNCYDGFGAAWAAWKALGDSAEYLPAVYGQGVPDIPDGAVVTMVDFSLGRAQLLALRERCDLTVLDHHETARQELEGLDFCHFDMEKSGARLAWEHWHPGEPIPALLEYIEDRDLWCHKLRQTHEVSSALRSYPMDFEVWDSFAYDALALRHEGATILRHTRQQVAMICDQAMIWMIDGYAVPVVNATAFWSEVGHELLERHPTAKFSASYHDTAEGTRKWSLRSRGDFSVGELAKQYGGGGHVSAAGFIQHLAYECRSLQEIDGSADGPSD